MAESVSVKSFYGKDYKPHTSLSKPKTGAYLPEPYRSKSIIEGPSLIWKVFRKQAEILDFVKTKQAGLMAYVFEDSTDGRLFLAADPQVFWHYDCQRPPASRSSYEIIQEFSVCKLYFDLEYELTLNPESNGPNMVDLLIRIVILYLNKIWNVSCSKSNVMNLDSTTSVKFSRHLIFQLPRAIFLNNYHVGNFIRYVCSEIRESFNSSKLSESLEGSNVCLEELKSLFIVDSKGGWKLFCDESVYSKNRHFRMFGSTKKGKNSPLILSNDNEFQVDIAKDREKHIFLSSLITYIPGIDGNKRILEFGSCESKESTQSKPMLNQNVPSPSSPYPAIDKFINSVLAPGRIYRSAYFSTSNNIVYDTIGNRYCGNIGRQHKSQNVKYVVDLRHLCYYQKCHDIDCAEYKSDRIPLPQEICFLLTDASGISTEDGESGHGIFGIPDEDMNQVFDAIEDFAFAESSTTKKNKSVQLQRFPSFGVSDDDFLAACKDF